MKKILLIASILLVVFISDCTENSNITGLFAQAYPVKEFLNEYPNAQISAVMLNVDAVKSVIDEIRKDCDNSIPINPYWKISIYDAETNFTVFVWADVNTTQPICIVKKGGVVSTPKTNVTQNTTTSMVENTTSTTAVAFRTPEWTKCFERAGNGHWYHEQNMTASKCYDQAVNFCHEWNLTAIEVQTYDNCCVWGCVQTKSIIISTTTTIFSNTTTTTTTIHSSLFTGVVMNQTLITGRCPAGLCGTPGTTIKINQP